MDDCVFCKIVRGEIPAYKIWEDEKHIAILSNRPNTEGFTVVLTKKHKPSYAFDNDDETISNIVLATKKVAKVLDNFFDDVGRCGMIFEGFGVDHLHSKIYPMHGTGDMEEWEKIESKKVKTYFDKYPGYLSSNDSEKVDDEKLAALAENIRNSIK